MSFSEPPRRWIRKSFADRMSHCRIERKLAVSDCSQRTICPGFVARELSGFSALNKRGHDEPGGIALGTSPDLFEAPRCDRPPVKPAAVALD